MEKIRVLLVLFVFAAGLIFVSNEMGFAWSWGKQEAEAQEAESEASSEELIVVHSFKSDEEMAEFEQLYVAKQATFGRMGVLQAYFAMEQNNLLQVDRQMEEKFGFKMDPTKMYDLNRDTKEVREVGTVPPPAQAPAQ